MRTDSTRIMRDQKDQEAWEKCYYVATAARWGPANRGRRSRASNERVYRETHKRNLRPHQQVEQARKGEYDRRNAVGRSHTIKVDEASGSDS